MTCKRFVHQIEPKPATTEQQHRLFSEFASTSNIILLGDPGAGKTHVFQESAAADGDAICLTVRDFLNVPSFCKGQTLFIDGLDERRGGRGDDDTIDAIVRKLFAVSPSKVRISCRIGIWLGESDLSALRAYFGSSGGVTVLQLQPLSDDERDAIIKLHGFEHPKPFVQVAHRRGLDDLLGNPQNLILLCEAVRDGQWPRTRKDLFAQATALLLTEPNKKHARKGSGVYSGDELRDAAGAACAARLIADVGGLGLDATSLSDAPSYRTLRPISHDLERVNAALGRRAFRGIGHDRVDYSHRTVAEYLGAEWLANRVRAGAPFGRVRALMGVDGHPASELRGLHAWLAVHLPEHARALIDVDPFGVLLFGDAAALSLSDKRHLLTALGELSQVNPWFRSGEWSTGNIGALADEGLAEDFRAILAASKNFSLRSVVLDAVGHGTPFPALLEDLATILANDTAPFAERSKAFRALARMGQPGKKSVLAAFERMKGNAKEVRLCCEILAELYGAGTEASNVVALIDHTLLSDDELVIGTLWPLAEVVPSGEVAVVLDGIAKLGSARREETRRRNASEVGYVIDKLTLRALEDRSDVTAKRLWRWLDTRREVREEWSYTDDQELRGQLVGDRGLQHGVVVAALDDLKVNDDRWLFYSKLGQTVVHAATDDDLLEWIVDYVVIQVTDEKRKFLFELAMRLSFRATPRALKALDRLVDLGERDQALQILREQLLSVPIDDWRKEDAKRQQKYKKDREADRHKTREDFEVHRETIRSGAHDGWLRWLGEVYYACFYNVDEKVSGRERLITQLGAENAEIAIDGLVASTRRTDAPTLDEFLTLLKQAQWRPWWIGFIAGLDEVAGRGTEVHQVLSRDVLTGAIAVDLRYVTRRGGTSADKIGWKRSLLNSEPVLVRDTYLAVAKAELHRQDAYVHGLHELLNANELAHLRAETVLSLLRDFPDAPEAQLKQILTSGLAAPACHEALGDQALRVIHNQIAVSEPNRRLWLIVAYFLRPEFTGEAIETESKSSVDLVWLMRDMSGGRRSGQSYSAMSTPAELGRMVRMAGRHFPLCPSPMESNGDTNAWDGSQFVQHLVDKISADVSPEATSMLEGLVNDGCLTTHREHVLHALANQRVKRRDAEYRQPSWEATIASLSHGQPANAADLQALIVEHLTDIAHQIASNNTDIYKRFWNEDPGGKITTPKNEESCRDVLVDLLRARLQPLKVVVEPEGHMSSDRRADIAVFLGERKAVIELKRDFHAKVWTAVMGQLDRFYTRDPQCSGYGIYGVFWFGQKRPRRMPSPPGAMKRPESAPKMKEQIESLLPPDRRAHLAVAVFDLAGNIES